MRDKGKHLFIAAMLVALVFFGGYYAGRSSQSGDVIVYAQSGSQDAVTGARATADYFMSMMDQTAGEEKSPAEPDSGEASGIMDEIDVEAVIRQDAAELNEPDISAADRQAAAGTNMSADAGEDTSEKISGDTQAEGRVNINTAGKDELTTLYGIGEKKAEAIIAYRETNGLFESAEEIMAVTGIGEGIYARIKENITI